MTTSFKPGVKLGGIRPEIATALTVISSIFDAKGIPLTVTSALDGEHSAHSARHPRSLHYEGLALDIRLPSRHTGRLEGDEEMAGALRQALGPEFDVALEASHIHVEYDPKEPA